jgi:hypothetical protein
VGLFLPHQEVLKNQSINRQQSAQALQLITKHHQNHKHICFPYDYQDNHQSLTQ